MIGNLHVAARRRGGPVAPPPPLGFTAPSPAALAPYLTTTATGGYTMYSGVPWGAAFGVASWPEPTLGGAVQAPVMNVYVPPGTPPPGGWPVVIRGHPNGSDYLIPDGSGALWDYLVVPCMTLGYVLMTIEFRHPVPNVSLGAPHFDAGYCIQFGKALSAAIPLDINRFHGVGQSRGNLLLWQTLSPDLADPGNACYAKRFSSKLKSMWGVNTQSTYSTTEFINAFIHPAERAAALADPAYADDARWGSTYSLIVNGTQPLPFMCITHDNPYVVPLPSYAIGTYSKADIDGNMDLRVHCPEFGKHIEQAMISRGASSRVVIADSVSGGSEVFADAVPWFKALDDNPEMTAVEARSLVMIRRRGGSAHYFPATPSGAFRLPTDLTPVTSTGEAVGALADGTFGHANRSNTVSPRGAALTQTTAAARPTLVSINSGARRGLQVDAVDDSIRVDLPNTTVDVRTYAADGLVLGPTARTSSRFTLGQDKVAGRTLGLIAAIPNATFNNTDKKFLSQFASELTGITYPIT